MKERIIRLLGYLDSWRFWALVGWIVMSAVVVWVLVLQTRLDDNIKETQDATKANTEAIAFLCDTNAIVESLAQQAVVYLRSEQREDPDTDRRVLIEVFSGYVAALRGRAACVEAEKQAIR